MAPFQLLSNRFGALVQRSTAFVCAAMISPCITTLLAEDSSPGQAALSHYLERRTTELAASSLADIQTADDWQQHRDEYRTQLREMLGLSPWPERTPLQPVVTGMLEEKDFIVEKLHFQSLPGLYVTGNLYRPREVTQPLPAILYVCGHASKKKGDVSYGNKTAYQHHGIWYARNGYVCLIVDTIQLGEIPGIHHGTHRLGMWWWHGRGYTPAGVETWNGMRALDYLQSRGEVDPERIGMTGRSGGGAYTWYVAALDDRVKAAVPVAGITSTRNHVVDGCVAGHCDCMYQVNLHGWDYPQLAALISPRPLLVSNQDTDRIFPLDGVVDVFQKSRRIYELQQAGKQIGLCIAAGGHEDVQELQNDAFRWMNRHLKQDKSQIEMIAEPRFPPETLTVFEKLPADERVTTIQDWFVLAANVLEDSSTAAEFHQSMQSAREFLLKPQQTLSKHAPAETPQIVERRTLQHEMSKLRLRKFQLTADQCFALPLLVLDHGEQELALPVQFEVLDEAEWEKNTVALKQLFPEFGAVKSSEISQQLPTEFEGTRILFAPRGVGPTRWGADETTLKHIRRRFPLLGTTQERLQAEDVKQALSQVARQLKFRPEDQILSGKRDAASWLLYACFMADENAVAGARLELSDLPTGPTARAQFLALDRRAQLGDVMAAVASRVKLMRICCSNAENLAYCRQVQQRAGQLEISTMQIDLQNETVAP